MLLSSLTAMQICSLQFLHSGKVSDPCSLVAFAYNRVKIQLVWICFADTDQLIKGNKANKRGKKDTWVLFLRLENIYFRQGKPTLGARAMQAAACPAGESDAGLYQRLSDQMVIQFSLTSALLWLGQQMRGLNCELRLVNHLSEVSFPLTIY